MSETDAILYGSFALKGTFRKSSIKKIQERNRCQNISSAALLSLDPDQLGMKGFFSDPEMGWSGAEGWIANTTELPGSWLQKYPLQEKSFIQYSLIRIYQQQRDLDDPRPLDTDDRQPCQLVETDDPDRVSLRLDHPLQLGDLAGQDQLLLNYHPLLAIAQLLGEGEYQVSESTHMGTWQQLIYLADVTVSGQTRREVVGAIDLVSISGDLKSLSMAP